ncbi:hypothetical protein [Streptomyces californicus]|uniref:hypothetical protein n=1 Tax=Streptomyces californicus TaxID=67351 RepID=UPI00371AEBB0
MTFEPRDLNLADPQKGFLHFVLYTEARLGVAASSLNAELDIEPYQTITPLFQEWLNRLERCEPNALHCTLVSPDKIPTLFHPCATEDKNSAAALGSAGCRCQRTFYDPDFGLPVVGTHSKANDADGPDRWSYTTYAPLELRPGDTFRSFITSRGLFWARTDKGLLSFLPQKHGMGYNLGYSGGGPNALAAYLTRIAENDGRPTPAGAPYEDAHPALVAWTKGSAAERGTNELTLHDLQAMITS